MTSQDYTLNYKIMTEFVDYRGDIHLTQGGCNAFFVLCSYRGIPKTFFILSKDHHDMISVVSQIRAFDNETLALKLPSFYENWKEFLVPSHLSYYKMSEHDLIARNGGKPIYMA